MEHSDELAAKMITLVEHPDQSDLEFTSFDGRMLAKALIELDSAVGELLDASLESRAIEAELFSLDETRGRIWATYATPSYVLKLAERGAADAQHRS